MEKPKVVQILMGIGGGCGDQISKKENYLLNPIKVLEKRGYVTEFWTLQKKGKTEEFFLGARVRRFSHTLSLLLHLFFARDVKLVYAHLRPYLPALLSPLSFKKCILLPHTYELGSNWFIRKFSLFFMDKFTRIFALTPYERQLYLRNGLRKEKVLFFPHAIDHSFFSKKPKTNLDKIRKRYGFRKGDFVVTTVANFRKFKNLDIIVGAFALFNEKIKNSKMLIVGKDQTKNIRYKEQWSKRYSSVEDVKDVVKREKISQNVIFTGGVDYKKVREILSISNIFVNNSNPETMGLSVYEAASAGVPLCLSDIGSFRTVFSDMALYSPPRDESSLAKRYIEYYRNPQLRKKVGARLKPYLKKWDYPVFMKKFEKIFSEILD